MSKIRGRDTKPEIAIRDLLRSTQLEFEEQVRTLPGRPDFVIRTARVAIFVDGDFWHGRRFAGWRRKLSEKWETKIAANMARDLRNRRQLRNAGWKVIRLWEKQIAKDPRRALRRIRTAVMQRLCTTGEPGNLAAISGTAGCDDNQGN